MENYSVLMSVYAKDDPAQVLEAGRSMLEQTLPPAQFVLVEDGPVSDGIRQSIESLRASCKKADIAFTGVPLAKNQGLGPALNQGLDACRHELVARMDADDVSLPERCRLEVSYLTAHPEISVLSGTILEFSGSVPAETDYEGLTKKAVPSDPEEVLRKAPYRNPVNHPCAMLRRSKVSEVGGYRSVPGFEDYDLWLRLLFRCQGSGQPVSKEALRPTPCIAALPQPLLLMRTKDMYDRRGGISYAKKVLSFRNSMYQNGYISLPMHILTLSARLAVSLIPPELRRVIYHKFLRKRS